MGVPFLAAAAAFLAEPFFKAHYIVLLYLIAHGYHKEDKGEQHAGVKIPYP